jgi:hypothetical protein
MKEADGKTTRERLRDCYLRLVNSHDARRENRRRDVELCNNLLVDLLPEPAAIRNVWKNKLALVKGERTGSVIATER